MSTTQVPTLRNHRRDRALLSRGRLIAVASLAAFVAYARPAASQVADLAVTATGSANTVTLGHDVTYTVTVTNDGPSDATQVMLTETLSTGLALVSASSNQGACGPLERYFLANRMICGLGLIRAGEAATVGVVVTSIAERYVGSISNDAVVSSDVADPSLANNAASVVTAVVTPSLTVTKVGSGSGLVTSIPSGIDCGMNCISSFPDGTLVTLTSVAAADSSFGGWSGAGCSGSGSCTVDVNAALQVTARFTSTAEARSGGCESSGGSTALSLLGLAARARRRRS